MSGTDSYTGHVYLDEVSQWSALTAISVCTPRLTFNHVQLPVLHVCTPSSNLLL